MKNTDTLPPNAAEILRQMTEAEWRELWNRLLYFTIKNYAYVQYKAGVEVEDLIQEAILDVLAGVRSWRPVDEQDSEKSIPLFVFLCYTIRSKVSHLIKRQAREVHLDDEVELDFFAERLASRQWELESDRDAIYNELSRRLLELVSGDLLLTEITKLLIKMPDVKPREIAIILDIPIEDVQNAQKRLLRKTKKLLEERG